MKKSYFNSERELEEAFCQALWDQRVADDVFNPYLMHSDNIPLGFVCATDNIYCQVPLPGHGTLDVIHEFVYSERDKQVSTHRICHLIELKNVPIQLKDIDQAMRYRSALLKSNYFNSVYTHIIGPDIRVSPFLIEAIPSDIVSYYLFDFRDGVFHFTKPQVRSFHKISEQALEHALISKLYSPNHTIG